MAAMKFEVAVFDGQHNFSVWRIKMKALLRREGTIMALEGKYPEEMKKEKRDEIEEKAHSAIQLSLSDNVLREVADEKTAAKLWKRLEGLYMKKSLTTRLYLKQRLYGLKMKEGTPILEHLDEFNKIVIDMNNLDIKLENEDMALIVLCSLPSSYETFVNSMLYGRDSISLEDVKTSLCSVEMRSRFGGNDTSNPGEGLMIRSRSSSDGSRWNKSLGPDKRQVECHYCHKRGHIKSECWLLKKREGSRAANVVEGVESVDLGTVLAVSFDESTSGNPMSL